MWTSKVCFLCVKTFHNSDSKYQQNVQRKLNELSSKRFALFCERFLKLPPESPLIFILSSEGNHTQSSSRTSSSSSFLDLFCSGCLEILDGTFQLYKELWEVQLKMAWRLGQWEALLKRNKTSKPSSKLNSLLHQKLAEQLEAHLGIEKGNGDIEEVREMRNLLLTHCRNTRNEMLDHRTLLVALDRCSVPFPVATRVKNWDLNDFGTTASFLALDSNSENLLPNDDDDLVVKREPEDNFDLNRTDDDDDDHHEDHEAMDFETDFEFMDSNQQPESDLTTMSKPPVMAEQKRKPPRKNVAVKKPTPQQNEPENADGIRCEECGKMIPNLEKLQRHYTNHNDWWRRMNKGKKLPTPFQCHFCWQTFTTQQMRWVHQEIGSHDKSMTSAKFTCSEEGCTGMPPFTTFEDLETHFENIHRSESESVFKCSLCDWPFSSDDMRQVHELVHGHYIRGSRRRDGQNKSFKCPRCECQGFQKFPPLQTHFISQHTTLDSERIHKCHKCPMAYRLPTSLAQHLKTHEMEEDLANTEETGAGSSKYFICEECGKHCATPKILADHKFQAHRTKQCNLCGETLLATALSRHMWRAHNVADDPHPCPVCQKIFLEKYLMRRHLENVHPQGNGIAPEGEGEICHICSKSYQRKGLLHRHLKIAHQIEAEEFKRPARFVCPDCGMGYYYKASLHAHIDAKHKGSEERKNHFPCTICSKTFWRKSLQMKHVEEVHPQQELAVQQDQDESLLND